MARALLLRAVMRGKIVGCLGVVLTGTLMNGCGASDAARSSSASTRRGEVGHLWQREGTDGTGGASGAAPKSALDTFLDGVKTASDKASIIVSAYSSVKSYIGLLHALEVALGDAKDTDLAQEIIDLRKHLDDLGRAISWHESEMAREEAIGGLRQAVITTNDAIVYAQSFDPPKEPDLAPDLTLVTSTWAGNLGNDVAFERLYLPADTDGALVETSQGKFGWKDVVPWNESDLRIRVGNAFDWRDGLPVYMTGIALRLSIMAMQHNDFYKDGKFYGEIAGYHDRLKQILDTMDEGIHCGYRLLRPATSEPNGFGEPFTYVIVTSCADVYTGINATHGHDYAPLDPILRNEYPFVDGGIVPISSVNCCDSGCPQTCANAHIDYLRWFDTNIQAELDRERLEVMEKTPRFALQSMVDSLYVLMNQIRDFTDYPEGKILTNATSPLVSGPWCMEEVNSAAFTNVSDAPFRLALAAPCSSGPIDSQHWKYDRVAQTVTNAGSGSCLTAASCDAATLAQTGSCPPSSTIGVQGFTALVAPCDGSDGQRWTYSMEDQHLYNARDLALELHPNENSLQLLVGDFNAVIRNQTYRDYRSPQTFNMNFEEPPAWLLGNVPLQAVNQDPGTELQYGFSSTLGNVYSGPITLPEGQSTLFYRTVDANGVASSIQSRAFQVDTRAPSATATMPDATTLQFNAVDPTPGSGVSGVYATTYSGTTAGQTQFLQGAQPYITVDPTFSRVDYWAKDVAGNVEDKQTIRRYPATILGDAPVGYWRLGDTALVAKDASGFGHDGTYVALHPDSPLAIRGQAGAIADDPDTAVRFWLSNNPHYNPQGQYNWVSVPNDASLAPAHVSVEAWVNMYQVAIPQTYSSIAMKGDPVFSTGYGLFYYNYKIFFYVGSIGVRVAIPLGDGPANAAATLANYRHIVGTFDGTKLSIYMDGVLYGSGNGPANATTASNAPFEIGKGPYLGWNGTIDEVAVYDKALTQAQIQEHFQAARH